VLGELDDPGMEIEIAVRKFGVPHVFSPAALKQANKLPNEVRDADLGDRVDLRDVPLVTIDGEDARDFDDAVYCEPVKIGRSKGYRLLVAIADVSHYVKPGDGLDTDAIERSTSVYFPRRVIPMLPEKTVERPVLAEPGRRPPDPGVRHGRHRQGRSHGLPVLPGRDALGRAHDL
jgi:ribonuclease R